MKARIGMVTIGQSPRDDVTPDLEKIWGNGVELVQKGALDGLALKEIHQMAPEKGDYALVTRLRDGTQVVIGKRHILGRMQEKIDELNQQGVNVILLLCTGEFPEMESRTLIIKPQEVLHKTVAAIAGKKRVGILTPLTRQMEQARKKWLACGVEVETACGSPYTQEKEYLDGVEALSNKNISLIVMDCMGYTWEMKQKARRITDKPIILPRTLIARVISELLS